MDGQGMSSPSVYGGLVPLQGTCAGVSASKEEEPERLPEGNATNISRQPYDIPTQSENLSDASVATFFQRLLTTPLRWTHPRIPRPEVPSSALVAPGWNLAKVESSKVDEPACKYTVIGPLLGTSKGALRATLQLPDDTAQVQYSSTPPKGLEPVASGTLDIRFTRRKTGRPSNSGSLAATTSPGSYSGCKRSAGRSSTSTGTGLTGNTITSCSEYHRCHPRQRGEMIQDTTWVEWLLQPIFSSREEKPKDELDVKISPAEDCATGNANVSTQQDGERVSDGSGLTDFTNASGHVTLHHIEGVTNPQSLSSWQSLRPSVPHLDVNSIIVKSEAQYSVDSLPFEFSATRASEQVELGLSFATCRHRAKKGPHGRIIRHFQSVFYPSRFNFRRKLLAENCEWSVGSSLTQAWNIYSKKHVVRESRQCASRIRSTSTTTSANTAILTAARGPSSPLRRPFTWRPRRLQVAHSRFYPYVCGSRKVTQHEGQMLDNWVTVKATRHRTAIKDKSFEALCLDRTNVDKLGKEGAVTRSDLRWGSQQQTILSTLFSSSYAPPHRGVYFVRMRRSAIREGKDGAVQEGPRANLTVTPDADSLTERSTENSAGNSSRSQLGIQGLILNKIKKRSIVLSNNVSHLVKIHDKSIVKRAVPGICSSRCSTCSTPRKILLTASRCPGEINTASISACVKTSETPPASLSTRCITPSLSSLHCPVFCRNSQQRKHLTQRPALKPLRTSQIAKHRGPLTPNSLKETTKLQLFTPNCFSKKEKFKLAARLSHKRILKKNTHDDVRVTDTTFTYVRNSTAAKLDEKTGVLTVSSI